MVLLSRRLPFSLYSLSAWSRAIVVPLSIVWAHKPVCPVPAEACIPELDVKGSVRLRAEARSFLEEGWASLFEAIDLGLKWIERLGLRPLRQLALDRCEQWIVERLDRSDGLGGILPPIINTIVAFRCRGYEVDHPLLAGQIAELERLTIEEADSLRVEPCKSPVWDTSQALNALLEAGVDPADGTLSSAAAWLLEREVTAPGDCQVVDPAVPVGGWYFEYANEFYPDCDDTAEVLLALARMEPARTAPEASAEPGRLADLGEPEESAAGEAIRRGVAWLLAMQNADGGWASFDRGCDRAVLTFIPFADHNAMIDPSTVDITSRAVEALVHCGLDGSHPAIARAVDFILALQEPDGSWYGRWGANYLYGTWLALGGLAAAGFPMDDPRCRLAVDWLVAHQNEDGGWGESLRSYHDPAWKGRGASTAAQTAWALHGLVRAGAREHAAVRKGLRYLLDSQEADGIWRDESWTGTGFPGVFYLNYHYYAIYFPVLTLGSYLRARDDERGIRIV
jgi:squalene-hopene/tetraprenyl-beta-curcumene cyclase